MNVRNPWAMIRNRLNRENIYCTPEYWDSKATEHDGDAASMWPNNNLNALYRKEIADTYARHIPDLHGKSVLEVGCGTGRNTRFLVDQGANVVAIDFSQRAIDLAKQKFSGGNPIFRLQSAFDIEDEHEFDVVMSWGTITMACKTKQQLVQLMKALFRALKPGGSILLLEPIHAGCLHRVLAMNPPEFARVMEHAGFRISTIQPMHFWPARLLLAFVPWPAVVTNPAYHAGQWIMKNILPNRTGGDYQAILAVTK